MPMVYSHLDYTQILELVLVVPSVSRFHLKIKENCKSRDQLKT